MKYNGVVVKVDSKEEFDKVVVIAKEEGYKAPSTLEYNLYRESSYLHFTKRYLVAHSHDWVMYNEYEVTPYEEFKEYLYTITNTSGKEKATGGSADYYKLTVHNPKNGATIDCETEDIIFALVGDNFALGNVVKALRRIYLDSQGKGKEGVDMTYDINKCKYFLDSFQRRYGDKEK